MSETQRRATSSRTRSSASAAASWTRKHVATVQRCPTCYHTLERYTPVAQTSVRVAELAARIIIDGDTELTSRTLARLYNVSAEYAGALLRRAESDGLVRRARVPRVSGGGSEYRYWPTRASVAYLHSDSLAAALPSALERREPRAS